jgi:hypothetical protein
VRPLERNACFFQTRLQIFFGALLGEKTDGVKGRAFTLTRQTLSDIPIFFRFIN